MVIGSAVVTVESSVVVVFEGGGEFVELEELCGGRELHSVHDSLRAQCARNNRYASVSVCLPRAQGTCSTFTPQPLHCTRRMQCTNTTNPQISQTIRKRRSRLRKVAREKFNKAKQGEIVYKVVREGQPASDASAD